MHIASGYSTQCKMLHETSKGLKCTVCKSTINQGKKKKNEKHGQERDSSVTLSQYQIELTRMTIDLYKRKPNNCSS